jgi:hypothetical protein
VEERFARRCDVTGCGMNEGYVWGDGTFYTSTEDVTIKELRSDIRNGAYDFDEIGAEELLKMSDAELLEYAYENEVLYCTEWEESEIEEQGYYYDKDGNEIEI